MLQRTAGATPRGPLVHRVGSAPMLKRSLAALHAVSPGARSSLLILLCFVALCGSFVAEASPASEAVLANIRLPPGFRLELFADVPGARSLAQGAKGAIFVGTRDARVYAVSSEPQGRLVRVIADQLNMPNGVAFGNGALFVAEVHRIIRFDDIESSLDAPPAPSVVRDDLPRDRHHGWRYIAFGPDGRLYIPIGAPCNVCNDPRYAVITRMNVDGSGREVFARGVRHSQGLAWRGDELWFTDDGRDFLGEDEPPCELNRAPRIGLDFGFPYCHGSDVADPDFGRLGECSKMTAPAAELPSHSAPLGVKFYTAAAFPEAFHGRAFIAEHGSRGRSAQSGFRISTVKLEGDKAVSYEPFAVGFADADQIFGRPVDLLMLADGSMLVSDDHAGAVYRVVYSPQ